MKLKTIFGIGLVLGILQIIEYFFTRPNGSYSSGWWPRQHVPNKGTMFEGFIGD